MLIPVSSIVPGTCGRSISTFQLSQGYVPGGTRIRVGAYPVTGAQRTVLEGGRESVGQGLGNPVLLEKL